MSDDKDLEQLRALVVDLAKDGHTKQAEAAANLHDAIKRDRDRGAK